MDTNGQIVLCSFTGLNLYFVHWTDTGQTSGQLHVSPSSKASQELEAQTMSDSCSTDASC